MTRNHEVVVIKGLMQSIQRSSNECQADLNKFRMNFLTMHMLTSNSVEYSIVYRKASSTAANQDHMTANCQAITYGVESSIGFSCSSGLASNSCPIIKWESLKYNKASRLAPA